MSDLTQSYLKDIARYNPLNGEFTWIKRVNGRVPVGSVAGTVRKHKICKKKYIIMQIKRKSYLAHRLAFLYMNGCFPEFDVDHINGNGMDNRWCNLRLVTRQVNNMNAKKRCNNKSGMTGVYINKVTGKFYSFIGINKKSIYLGIFDNIFDAACARKSAEKLYGFHPNHGIDRPS